MISYQLPSGVPGFTPVSISISNHDVKNLSLLSASHINSHGVLLSGLATEANLSYEALGEITIQY